MTDLRNVTIKAPPKDHVATLTAVSKTMHKEDEANSLGRAVRPPGTLKRELHQESEPDMFKDFVDGTFIRQYQKYSGGRLHYYFVFPDGSWTDTIDRALLYKENIKNDPLPDVLGDPLTPPQKPRKKKKKRERKTQVRVTISAASKTARKERRGSPKVTVNVECESETDSDHEEDCE